MSYEKRVKDLLGRLVALSPEPPPFPEEVTMVEPVARRASRPVLMFAGAAAIVMLLALPFLLSDFGDQDAATTVPAPGSSTTTLPDTTTSIQDDTSTTQPVTVAWESVVYLTQEPVNTFNGNPALVPLWVSVAGVGPDEPFTAALAHVSASGWTLPPGFDNLIPPQVQIVDLGSVEVDGEQVWVADMSEAFRTGANPAGHLADVTMLNQLIYTITDNTMQKVLFTVDGEPVDAFGTDGIDLSEPVDRNSFIDEINLIFLTEPVILGEDGYRVEGVSNVFEAAMTVRVVDTVTGETIHEEPVMATSGSGTWGTFAVDIDADLVEPGVSEIWVFWYSAEDGTPANVVTVPIPEPGIWVLVPLDG
jgi:spore germination protein GerM